MAEHKYEVGQTIFWEHWNDIASGRIVGISIYKEANSAVTKYTVMTSSGGSVYVDEREIHPNRAKILDKQRRKAKRVARATLTRAKKALDKNKAKLAELEKQLAELE